MNAIKFLFFYTDYSINTKLNKQSPIEYSMKQMEIDLIEQFELSFDIFLALDEFHSQDNLYASWSERHQQKITRVSRISRRVVEFSSKKKRLITFNIRSDWYYKKYIRTYKTFFEFIYQIGGLFKVLMFIGSLITVGMNCSLMNVAISNQVFNIIDPSKEKGVLQNYEDLRVSEENGNITAPIFLSLNPILKQISFEYYRFERNRGMPFSAKEVASKIFCSCCQKKLLQQKDQVFKESGKAIEKVLDTTSVAKFAQESKAMKNLLLQNNAIMMGYMVRQNISFETLGLIKQELIQHQILISASPISLSYYKQGYLINGFITMRNQGDLSHKDLLLIKLMNLNPKPVTKFFISYYDRIKLIYPELHKESKNDTLASEKSEEHIITTNH